MKPRSLLTIAAALSLSVFSQVSTAAEARIISAGSTVTELLMAMDAQDQLVAVDLTSRHYLNGLDIPVLGYHRQLAAEGLLALNPTHLLGSPEMGPDSTLKLLSAAGVEVTALPAGNSLEDFKTRVDAVAAITGKQHEGEALKKDVTEKIALLQSAQLNDKPKVMFMMLSDGRPLTVAGDNTTVNTVITLAGGVNPAAEHATSYKPLSVEAIVEMQPDYILISNRTLDQIGGMSGMLEQQPLLAATPAFKNNNVIRISGYAILGGFGLASLDLATELNAKLTGTE